MRLTMRHAILLALPFALLVTGCSSTRRPPADPLPLHVALLPLSVEAKGSVGDAEEDVYLEIDEATANEVLGETLEGDAFVRVTRLSPPSEPLATASEWNEHWLREASRVRADLVLECALEYDRAVEVSRNERAWYSVPLFFVIGGPFSYWINDRTYATRADLVSRVYDASPAVLNRIPLTESFVSELKAGSESIDMDYFQRTEDNIGSFAITLIIPPGFLEGDPPEVRKSLAREVVANLGYTTSDRLHELAPELLGLESKSMLRLGGEPSVVRDAGRVHVLGQVYLDEASVDRAEARMWVGDQVVSGKILGPSSKLERGADGRRPYEFHVVAPEPRSLDALRLELFSGDDTSAMRSLTLPVE